MTMERELTIYLSNLYYVRSRSTMEIIEIDAVSCTIEERVVYSFRVLEGVKCYYNVYNYDIIDVKHQQGEISYKK